MTGWLEYSTKAHPYGQPPITIEEVFKVGDIVKADADWRRAMKRRGLTDADIELVQVDPFSAGYFDREVEKGRRLVSAVSYWRKDIKDNGYAHPIEGVVALVDLIENKIVHLVDEPDIIPIPKKSRNYDRASIPQTRNDVKPLDIVQKDGPSFYGRWLEGRLAELVVPRRLDRARRSRAAPDRVSAIVSASGRSSIGPASPT